MAHTFHLEYFVFIVFNAVFLSLSVEIIDGPRTDKSCYNVGDSGTVSMSYSVKEDAKQFRDLYKVLLRTTDGSIIMEGSWLHGDNLEKEARWITSILFNNTIVDYKIYIVNMAPVDNTANITFHVVNSTTGEEVARSERELTIKVMEECFYQPITTTQAEESFTNSKTTTQIPEGREQSSPPDLYQTQFDRIVNVSVYV